MKNLNDLELEKALALCVGREREATAEVLRYLREVETRKLYLARGFSSLFAYCTKKLGYSEPEAQLRIQAMRLVRAVPEVMAKIESGILTISVAAQIQVAARRERLEKKETKELVAQLSGSSKREAEKKLAGLFPEAPRPEKVRNVSENLLEIRFTVTNEEAALLNQLLDRKSHTNFERRFDKLFIELARDALRKIEKNPAQDASPQCPDKVPFTRHIPKATQRYVWKRDRGFCQYEDPLTKQRCQSKHALQLDHIKPFAQGGNHTPENLRLFCGAHNRWRSA